MSGDSKGCVIALDIGTTKIKCQILNEFVTPVGSAYRNVKLLYPKPGYVEISPEQLWDDILFVIKTAISDGCISIQDVKSIGISTQRATFITWRKSNGKTLHNFITWKDMRTKSFAKDVNKYWTIRILKFAAFIAHFFTRNTKMFVASRLKFMSNHTSIRLMWCLLNMPDVKQALSENDIMFGTLDTWLLYKLTNCQTYVTDISNASATGLFDPFTLKWGIMTTLLNIPKEILPDVVENNYNFGDVDPSILGRSIKIGCVISDQSSSMLGACCFRKDDIKITLGTGAFLNVNTGNSIHGSSGGMYPLVGWEFKNEQVAYLSEVPCNDSGSLIEWALESDLIESTDDLTKLIARTEDNGGVYYIAAFSGLGPPINDEQATSGFMGIKPTTRKEHLIRAILESIVYRVALTVNHLISERPAKYEKLRVDGGVSRNDFICQMLADITGLKIERLASTDLSIIGAGFLSGISCGLWENQTDLMKYIKLEKTFDPCHDEFRRRKYAEEMNKWLKAALRFKNWNEDNC